MSVPVKERAFLGHVTPYCFFKNPPSLGEALSEWESYCNPRGRKSETIPAAPLDLKMASGREDGSGVFFRDVSQFLCVFPAQGADGIATRTAHGEGKRKKYFSEEGGTFFGFFSYFFSSLCELLGDLNIPSFVSFSPSSRSFWVFAGVHHAGCCRRGRCERIGRADETGSWF